MKRKVTGLVMALIGVILVSLATLTIICLPVSREKGIDVGTMDKIYRAAEELGYDEKETERLFDRKNISMTEAVFLVEDGADPLQVVRLVATAPTKEYSENVLKVRRVADIIFLIGGLTLIFGAFVDGFLKRRYREWLDKEVGLERMRLVEMRNFAAFIDEGLKAGAGWDMPKFGDGWEGDDGLDERILKTLINYNRLSDSNIIEELDMTIKLTDCHIRKAIEENVRKTERDNLQSLREFIEKLNNEDVLKGSNAYLFDMDKMLLVKDIIEKEFPLEKLRSDCFEAFKDCQYLDLEEYRDSMRHDSSWDDFIDFLLDKNVVAEEMAAEIDAMETEAGTEEDSSDEDQEQPVTEAVITADSSDEIHEDETEQDLEEVSSEPADKATIQTDDVSSIVSDPSAFFAPDEPNDDAPETAAAAEDRDEASEEDDLFEEPDFFGEEEENDDDFGDDDSYFLSGSDAEEKELEEAPVIEHEEDEEKAEKEAKRKEKDENMLLKGISLIKFIDGMMSDNKLSPKEITSLKGAFSSWPTEPKGEELFWLVSPFMEDKNRPKVAAVRQLRNEVSELIEDLAKEGCDTDSPEAIGVAFRALALGLTADNTLSGKDIEALKDWFEAVGVDENYTQDPAIAGVYSVWKEGKSTIELFNCLRNVGCLYLGKN